MPFGTRAELAAVIGGYLQRTNLATQIPDFIRLTEARLNRLLRDPDQIVTASLTFTNGIAPLPADFGQMVAFGPAGTRIVQVTPGEFGTFFPAAGDPLVFTVSGGTIRTLPSSTAGTAAYTYYRGIPALTSDDATNWLLTRAPDLYLYGSLLQAEFFGWNDERLPFIKNAFDEAIAELRADGENRRWGAAPLAPRIRRA